MQTLNQNPCQNIFQENSFKLKIIHQIGSVVSSLNKNLLAISYTNKNIIKRSASKIIIFLFEEGKWIKYFRMRIPTTYMQLLCFANNNTQLLFYIYGKNCIQCLSINQNDVSMPLKNSNINIFFKLPSSVIEKMIPSNDQKMILILQHFACKLFDVTEKIIISTFIHGGHRQNQIRFFDSTYLIQTNNLEIDDMEYLIKKQQINFKNTLNMKVKKNLCLRSNACLDTDFYNNVHIQQLNCKSLSCFCFGIGILVVLNNVKLKLIRKIILPSENYDNFDFLGVSQRVALHSFRKNNNEVGLHVVDLLNLNVEISEQDNEDAGDCIRVSLNNQILMVQKLQKYVNYQKSEQTKFWLTK